MVEEEVEERRHLPASWPTKEIETWIGSGKGVTWNSTQRSRKERKKRVEFL
jgi:hypothetical protein